MDVLTPEQRHKAMKTLNLRIHLLKSSYGKHCGIKGIVIERIIKVYQEHQILYLLSIKLRFFVIAISFMEKTGTKC